MKDGWNWSLFPTNFCLKLSNQVIDICKIPNINQTVDIIDISCILLPSKTTDFPFDL